MHEKQFNLCINCSSKFESPGYQDPLLRIILSLSERKYYVLISRIINERDLSSLSKEFSVTRERIKQIEDNAIELIINRAKRLSIYIKFEDIKYFLLRNVEHLPGIEKKQSYVFKQNFKDFKFPLLIPSESVPDIEGVYNETKIGDLDLPFRAYQCLVVYGITTVRELLLKSEEDLLEIKNFGRKSVTDVKIALKSLGLKLKED